MRQSGGNQKGIENKVDYEGIEFGHFILVVRWEWFWGQFLGPFKTEKINVYRTPAASPVVNERIKQVWTGSD